jgi:DNA-directed RNA polymerase specialized sigma24 family protein
LCCCWPVTANGPKKSFRRKSYERGGNTPRGFETGKPHGWLYTVARSLVTDLRRHDAVRPVIVHDQVALKMAPASDQIEKAVHTAGSLPTPSTSSAPNIATS